MSPRRKKVAFGVVVALQLGLLLTMIARRVHLLHAGQLVLLQCEPIDPRSLLSGDYVVLSFSISRLHHDALRGEPCPPRADTCNAPRLRRHETVYVGLRPRGKKPVQKVEAIARTREALHGYPVVLRGTVQSRTTSPVLRIRYGVEQYFLPQGEGRRIEGRLGKTSVEVAVDDSGESAIKRLFVAGQEVRFR